MEDYVGYRTWYLAEADKMMREDLAQEARMAMIKTLSNGDGYPNSYLRKVASSAMSRYLRKGRSIGHRNPETDGQRRNPGPGRGQRRDGAC